MYLGCLVRIVENFINELMFFLQNVVDIGLYVVPYILRALALPGATSVSGFIRELFYVLFRQVSKTVSLERLKETEGPCFNGSLRLVSLQMRIVPLYSPVMFVWVFWVHTVATFSVAFTDVVLAALSALNAGHLRSLSQRLRESSFEVSRSRRCGAVIAIKHR